MRHSQTCDHIQISWLVVTDRFLLQFNETTYGPLMKSPVSIFNFTNFLCEIELCRELENLLGDDPFVNDIKKYLKKQF